MSKPSEFGDLAHVVLEVSVEVGRSTMRLREIAQLSAGSVVVVDRLAGSLVDVRVNDELIARGELVAVDAQYGVRITEVVPAARL